MAPLFAASARAFAMSLKTTPSPRYGCVTAASLRATWMKPASMTSSRIVTKRSRVPRGTILPDSMSLKVMATPPFEGVASNGKTISSPIRELSPAAPFAHACIHSTVRGRSMPSNSYRATNPGISSSGFFLPHPPDAIIVVCRVRPATNAV